MGLLAILCGLAALGWTVMVFLANSMSDAPNNGFQGGWTIGVAWLIAAGFAAGWWWG